MQYLGIVQKDRCELQIQTSRIQVGAGQVSAAQMSLAPGTSQAAKLVMTMDLMMVMFPEGSLSMESVIENIIVITLKNIGLNIAALPKIYLHAL